MGILKGFITIGAMADNAPGQVSQFGELSDLAETYSKEKATYYRPAANMALRSFTAVDDSDVPTELPAGISTGVLDLAEHVIGLYNADDMIDFTTPAEFVTYLEGQFNNANYTNIASGDFEVNAGDSNKQFPEYLAWTMTSGSDVYQVRIWFSDVTFRAQYDDYSITVLPPVENVDDLNGSPAAVNNALAAYTKSMLVSDIETAKAATNETILKGHPLTWNDPGAGTSTLPTEWTVLIYGAAGDNNDAINQAIIDYLDNESSVDMSTWELIYPGLFSNTEFYLVPGWGNIAISEVSPTDGIYSPIGRLSDLLAEVVEYAPGYDQTYVESNATVTVSVWKSAMIASIGNVNNAAGNIRLDQAYPDYIAVPTSSVDFARMAVATQQFAIFLTEILEIAETATPTTVLPQGYTRVTRDGKHYVVYRLGEVNFICLTKYSYEA